MYFITKAFPNGQPILPIILDSHMLYAHCDILLDQQKSGGGYYSWTTTLRFHNRANAYVDYCNRINNLANQYQISPDRLESYIFNMRPGDTNSLVYQSVFNRRHLL